MSVESAGIVRLKTEDALTYTDKCVNSFEAIKQSLLYDTSFTAIAQIQPENAIAGVVVRNRARSEM
mgnify:CR=1 FL=1